LGDSSVPPNNLARLKSERLPQTRHSSDRALVTHSQFTHRTALWRETAHKSACLLVPIFMTNHPCQRCWLPKHSRGMHAPELPSRRVGRVIRNRRTFSSALVLKPGGSDMLIASAQVQVAQAGMSESQAACDGQSIVKKAVQRHCKSPAMHQFCAIDLLHPDGYYCRHIRQHSH
jgi:hypothetical protein